MTDEAKTSSTGLTFPQIAAGALAAATAAIMGSFMGVLGTIGGAAAASIVSTVGSALYQRSLESTRDKVKERLVVGGTTQQKVAGAVARATGKQAPVQAPGQRAPQYGAGPAQAAQAFGSGAPTRVAGTPRGPGGPPGQRPGGPRPDGRPGVPPTVRAPGPGRPGGERTLRAGGRTVSTQVSPQNGPTRIAPGAPGPMPTSRIPDARGGGTPPGGVPPTARSGGPNGPGVPNGPWGDDAATQLTSLDEPATPARRMSPKKWIGLAGLAASIFAIGLLASFGVETAAGHPLSGGESGTSVGSIFGQPTGTAEATTPTEPTEESGSTTTSGADGSSPESTGEQSDQETSGPTTSRSPESTSQRQVVPTNVLPRFGNTDSTNG